MATDYSKSSYADLSKGLGSTTLSEIIRKAQSGIALDVATPQKQELYNREVANVKGHIIKKAQSGVAMDNTNPWKQSIYDQYATKPNNTANVNSIYDNQLNSQLQSLYASRDKAVGQLNQQKQENSAAYQGQRNQADVVNAQNVQRLREMMASSGLASSGENVTASVGLNNARQSALNSLNLQESQATNDINRQIADLNNPANEQALRSSIEAQRAQALYNAGRDTTSDNQWQQQFNQSNNQFNQNLAFQKEQFNSENEWRKFTFNNMSASEKAQMDLNKSQFGEEMAWRMYEMQYQTKAQTASNQALINFYKTGAV